ncbi:MAG: tRNA (adenosine(37)-N6)-threonylcarbamoyltransferase complex transferase subunit TsaD [Ruminococcus sp.]|jgi:N6-L-threonylcarbamoyladenine synthase|nr:tRNA (adenosine(37)-N6)-threonylcarbamoyltransferase complex transferase subunit TsaD [Ruminococcus sp.]
MKILGIETSCDETAAAVVEDGKRICSNVILSQAETHGKFGGVVPEIASRMHAEGIYDVTAKALSDAKVTLSEIDAVAVTFAPGLVGALLVGVSFAKSLAFTARKPLIPVHHIAGHIAANYLSSGIAPPYLALVVSGGHTNLVRVKDYTEFEVIGRTVDDAAGEAFDKAARVLSFPYPGGVYIDEAAKSGNPKAYRLPKPQVEGFNFSFSGLKTAVVNASHTASMKGEKVCAEDLAASFQSKVCEILTEKTELAAKEFSYTKVSLCGGVAANSGIRSALRKMCGENGFELYIPPVSLCGDNAAMIAAQGYYEFLSGNTADEYLNAVATLPLTKKAR